MGKKRCPVCGEDKDLEEFAWKFRALGVRAGTCKLCQKIYRDNWYQENRQKVIDATAERRRRNKEETKEWIIQYLLSHPCVDCGETDIVVLEFDHRDPRGKRLTVSGLVQGGYTLSKVQSEVAKCVVRCANCHRKRTAEIHNWYKRR